MSTRTGGIHLGGAIRAERNASRQRTTRSRPLFCVSQASPRCQTVAFEEPDENGWIVAQVVEVPGAISQGRTREEARKNVVDALRLMLSPDDGETADGVALELLLSA